MFKKLPKIAKISLSILAGLILILLLLYITIQTPLFKNQVRNYLNKKISQTTQTDFNIGKIRGNLLAKAELSNISMKVDQNTILSISNIKLKYSPFPLLRRHVDVDSIALQSPYINLEGFLSMLDNLSKKPDSVSQPSPQDTNSESKGYRIRLA
ncbi:MAG TPA: AsmA family protein, partial [bacterium]|nr:AsmA family protein [bacterium]